MFTGDCFAGVMGSRFFKVRTGRIFRLKMASRCCDTVLGAIMPGRGNTVLCANQLMSTGNVKGLLKTVGILGSKNVPCGTCVTKSKPSGRGLRGCITGGGLSIRFLKQISRGSLIACCSGTRVFISLGPDRPFNVIFPRTLLTQYGVMYPYANNRIRCLVSRGSAITFISRTSPSTITDNVRELKRSPITMRLGSGCVRTFHCSAITERVVSCLGGENGAGKHWGVEFGTILLHFNSDVWSKGVPA